MYSVKFVPPQLSHGRSCPDTCAIGCHQAAEMSKSEVLSPGPVRHRLKSTTDRMCTDRDAPATLGSELPGQDQRHVLPGRTTSCLWRHMGTLLWSTWVSKGPRRGFRGRGKPAVTCWPDHLCTLQCCPWSHKDGDR